MCGCVMLFIRNGLYHVTCCSCGVTDRLFRHGDVVFGYSFDEGQRHAAVIMLAGQCIWSAGTGAWLCSDCFIADRQVQLEGESVTDIILNIDALPSEFCCEHWVELAAWDKHRVEIKKIKLRWPDGKQGIDSVCIQRRAIVKDGVRMFELIPVDTVTALALATYASSYAARGVRVDA